MQVLQYLTEQFRPKTVRFTQMGTESNVLLVKYSLQNANDDGYTVASWNLLGRTEDVITPEVRKFEDAYLLSHRPDEGGKVLVISICMNVVHTLQLENNDGTEPKRAQMKQGATIPAPSMRVIPSWAGVQTALQTVPYRKYAGEI
ncbi:MAG: hypothetical protein ACLTAF_02560 [Blautia coccoides]